MPVITAQSISPCFPLALIIMMAMLPLSVPDLPWSMVAMVVALVSTKASPGVGKVGEGIGNEVHIVHLLQVAPQCLLSDGQSSF